MKKLLALVLALVMTLGLATVSSNAAFTDEEKIDHTEAVEVMSSLGIIAGKPGGNFDPDGSVTRAEMAKMVSIALLGEIDPAAFAGAASDLTDISGHWAEGYIKFCVSNGIVSGKGNGIFDPDAQVTTVEAAKMLLVALGYNADIREYKGSQWTLPVMRDAQQKGLLDDLTNANTTAAMDRDDAAQMIYNTLDAVRVVERQSINAQTGEVTLSYVDADAGDMNDKLLGKTFKGQIWMGTFTGNSNTEGIADKDNIRVTGNLESDYKSDNHKPSPATFPSDFDISHIGEEVKVIFKDGTSGTKNQPDKYDTIYGVYLTGTTQVYNITMGDLQEAKADDLKAGKIKWGDNLYTVANLSSGDYEGNDDYVAIVNNFGFGNNVISDELDATDNNDTATKQEFATWINTNLRKNSADTIKFVCNDTGDIERAYVVNTKTAEVSNLTSTNIQLLGASSKKLEDCENYDGIKKGDVVRYAELYQNGKTVTRFFDEATKVEGKITDFKSGAKAQVRIDGNWYVLDTVNEANVTDYTANTALTSTNVDDTVSLIVNGKYYVAYDVIDGYSDYAFATATQDDFSDVKVKVTKADGTEANYIISNDGTVNAAAAKAAIDTARETNDAKRQYGVLYRYELANSNTKIKLSNDDTTVVAKDNADGNKHTYNADNKTLVVVAAGGNDTTKLVVKPDATVFVYDTEAKETKVYKASDLKTFEFTDASAIQYVIDDGKVVAFAGVKAGKPTSSSTGTKFGYVIGKQNTLKDGDNVVELTIWNGESEDTLIIDAKTSNIAKGMFVRYPVTTGRVNDSDVGYSNLAGNVKNEDGGYKWGDNGCKVKSFDSSNKTLTTTTDLIGVDGKVVEGADTNWRVTSDTVFIGINANDTEGREIATPTQYTKSFDRDYSNVYLIYEVKNEGKTDEYNELVAVFIDEDNNITGTGDVDKNQTKRTVAAVENGTGSTALGTSGTKIKNAYLTVTTDKTTVIAGEIVTYTVTIHGDTNASATVTLTPGTNATASGITITGDTTNVTETTPDTVVTIASGKGDGTVVKFTVLCDGVGNVQSDIVLA